MRCQGLMGERKARQARHLQHQAKPSRERVVLSHSRRDGVKDRASRN